jgi:hypothetical protein
MTRGLMVTSSWFMPAMDVHERGPSMIRVRHLGENKLAGYA